MNTALLFLAMVVATPEALDSQAACESASTVLKDMRYVEGKTADPGDFSHPKVQARIRSCTQVAKLAVPFGRDTVFASIAIAYNESNFRPGLKGKAGELGKMQVMPKFHCTPYADLNDGKGGCTNPERAGVRALRFFQKEAKGDLRETLRRYNGSGKYADKVSGFVRAITRAYDRRTSVAQAGLR